MFRNQLEDGNIPATITKEIVKQTKGIAEPINIFYTIKEIIPDHYMEERKGKRKVGLSGDKQVILSSYLKKKEDVHQ